MRLEGKSIVVDYYRETLVVVSMSLIWKLNFSDC